VDPDTDPDPAFQVNPDADRIRIFFWSKIVIYLSLGLLKRTSKLQEKPSALKREHSALLKNMKFINFFLFLWVVFALLNPDTDLDCKSGSRDLTE
jgi:hypothetical protein